MNIKANTVRPLNIKPRLRFNHSRSKWECLSHSPCRHDICKPWRELPGRRVGNM